MAITIPESQLAGQRIETQTGRQQINVPAPVKGQGLVALGRGVERLGVATARVDYQQRLIEERQREEEQNQIDQASALGGLNEVKINTLDYDDGYYQLKGKAVEDGYGNYEKNINELYDTVREELPTPEAKAMYDSRAQQRRIASLTQAKKYQRAERQRWVQGEFSAFIKNARETGIANFDNPENIQLAEEDIRLGVEGRLEGEGAEAVQRLTADEVSELYKGVMTNWMVSDPEQAGKEYKKYKNKILPSERAEIEAKLNHRVIEQRAQNNTDRIVNSGLPFGEQLQEGRKVKNERERKLTLEGIRAYKDDSDRVKKEIYAEKLNTIKQSILKAPGLQAKLHIARNPDPDIKAEDRLKLIAIAKKGGAVETNWEVYYGFKQMPYDKFKKINLMDLQLDLAVPQLKELIDIQTKERKTGKLETVRTNVMMLEDALLVLDLPEDKENKEVSQIRTQFFQTGEVRFEELGEKPPQKEKQAVLNDMILEFKEKAEKVEFRVAYSDPKLRGIFKSIVAEEEEEDARVLARAIKFVNDRAKAEGKRKPTDPDLRRWLNKWYEQGKEPGEISGGVFTTGRGEDVTWGKATDEQRKTWLPDVSEEEEAGLDEQIRTTGEQPPYSDFMRRLFKRVSVLGFEFTDELKAEFREGTGK